MDREERKLQRIFSISQESDSEYENTSAVSVQYCTAEIAQMIRIPWLTYKTDTNGVIV